MTDTLTRKTHVGPLQLIFPEPADQAAWERTDETTAADTGKVVHHYRHRTTLRCLRLDEAGRVYGMDPEGVVRLFGRGGPLALHVVINMVFDQRPDLRPATIALPRRRP